MGGEEVPADEDADEQNKTRTTAVVWSGKRASIFHSTSFIHESARRHAPSSNQHGTRKDQHGCDEVSHPLPLTQPLAHNPCATLPPRVAVA